MSNVVRENFRLVIRERPKPVSAGFGGPRFDVPIPQKIMYNHSWDWARGHDTSSCSVTETDYDTFVTLYASDSAQGFLDNTDPELVTSIKATAADLLFGLTRMYLTQGCSILSLDATCAVLKKPHEDWKFTMPIPVDYKGAE